MDFPLKIAATTIRLERSGIFQGGRVSARGRISLEGIRVAEPLSVVAGGDDAYIESMNEAWLTAPIVIGEGVDLSRCTFAGTTGLDQVRPIGRSFSKGRGRRQRLAEDPRRTLRSAKTTISESQRAERYRQLRVGLESAGNIPGANDFYYGELENRRRDAALRRPFEYLTLSAYNLSSGYGLRAWRAIAWFVVLVLAACVGFRVDGFDPEPHRATARLDGDR